MALPSAVLPRLPRTELSLFSGYGGIGLGLKLAIPAIRTVGYVEREAYAAAVLVGRMEDALLDCAPVFSDVSAFDGKPWRGKVDLISGGFPCFVAGTLIDTAEGLKPIEEVKEGELVTTHKRRLRPVLKTMRRAGASIVTVRAMGAPDIRTTAEHPFWARLKTRRWNNERRQYDFLYGEPAWVEAKDLTKSHLLAQPLDTEDATGWEGASEAFWYIVGRWLGDGWIVNHKRTSKIPAGRRGSRVNSRVWKAIICCSFEEEQELRTAITAAGFHATASPERTGVKFHICSKSLVEFLRTFGRGAKNKHVPGFVLRAPRKILNALWRGWVESDGHEFENGKIGVTTISVSLAHGMARVARSVFERPVAVYRQEIAPTTRIEGRLVNQQTQFQVVVNPSNNEGFHEEGFCWTPVRRVVRTERVAEVFNLEVGEDNSYIADSFVVHNCQDISLAGKGAGLDGAASGLWFEYARIIGEVGPRFVFVENVRALTSRGLDRVLGTLADLGFDAEWGVFSAGEIGAGHKRERIFILAHRVSDVAHATSVGEREQADEEHALATGGEARRVLGGGGGGGEDRGALADHQQQQLRDESGRSSGEDGQGTSRPGYVGEAVADADRSGQQQQRSSGLLDGERQARGNDADGRGGEAVADAERVGDEAGRLVHARQSDVEGGSRAVVDAEGERREGRLFSGEDQGALGDEREQRTGGGRDGRRFPPLRDDHEGWRNVPAHLQPATVEPTLRGGPDGTPGGLGKPDATRADELRLLGNGVVPEVAARAFVELFLRLGD